MPINNIPTFEKGDLQIMSEKTRLIIVDDHTILREGLKALLSSDPELEIVGEAEDGEEAIRIAEKSKPDLVPMNLSMSLSRARTKLTHQCY